MMKIPHLSLLALAIFVNPAMAECNLILADIPALTECAKTQGYTISLQASQISNLLKETDRLRELQERDRKRMQELGDRLFELRTEVALLGLRKEKPSKK